MKYVTKILDNVCNINDFDVADEIYLTRGNQYNLCFQLFTEKSSDCGTSLTRYIPQGTVNTVEVKFRNIDDEYDITRVATNAYSDDKSIYCITVLKTDQLMFNSMEVTLYQDNNPIKFQVKTDIASEDIGERSCFT